MEKLKMHSGNVTSSNIEALAQIFPDCITEVTDENGQVVQAVDFDKLKASLSSKVVEGSQERYNFTWPQKSDAIRLANARTSKTIRPCREESLDFDNTGNLYIEGDNLDVIKVLRNTYRSRVKMIYIDPPYNTGNDFVYEDDFSMDSDEFLHISGQKDNDGNRLVVNSNSNGRFHTDWLNMIYPRLKVARDLLTDDGVIFISIDDNEAANLHKVCDEIFGESNFVAQLIVKRSGARQDSTHYALQHEYIMCYAKVKSLFKSGVQKFENTGFNLFDTNRNLKYKLQLLRKWGSNSLRSDRPNLYYSIKGPNNEDIFPTIYESNKEKPGEFIEIEGCWRWKKEVMNQAIKDGRVEFKLDKTGRTIPYERVYESDASDSKLFSTYIEVSITGSSELKSLMGNKVFSYPKSTDLIQHLMLMANIKRDDIILDFFSGSSTTAHTVLSANAADCGARKFVMIQLPEELDSDSEAFKAGYKTICDIGKDRVRRVGEKIKAELGDKAKDLDVGFRVLKLDSSNMEDVFYLPQEMRLESLISDNIKPDRTSEDLLFQTMLETDVLLSSSIRVEHINNKEVFVVRDGYLMACFDEHIDLATVKAIAERKPAYFITRDGSMASDDVADNMEQIFMAISANTTIKVL